MRYSFLTDKNNTNSKLFIDHKSIKIAVFKNHIKCQYLVDVYGEVLSK